MNLKSKKKECKGIGKAKGFPGCGIETYHRKYGLCKSKCYPEWLLNTDVGKLQMEKAMLKASKPRKDLERASSERKSKSSLETLKNNVKNVFHRYIRERDKHQPCISCGEPWHSDFHAGHFFKAELYSLLKYDENNVHGQCPGCNLRKEGNLSQYTENLPKKIGNENFKMLQEMAQLEKQINHKWDRERLKEIRAHFNKKYKELINKVQTDL